MKKIFFSLFSALLLVNFAPQKALATSVTLNPISDAYVHSSFPDTNFGSSPTLITSRSTAQQYASAFYLKFDLSGVPQSATINSAKLRLYLKSLDGVSPITLSVALVTADWSENGIKWSNQANSLYTDILAQVFSNSTYNSWDTTKLVTDWVNGTKPNYGVKIPVTPIQQGYYAARFASKEEEVAKRPELYIDYTVPGVTIAINPNTLRLLTNPTSTPTPTPTATPSPTVAPEENLSPTPTNSPAQSITPTATPISQKRSTPTTTGDFAAQAPPTTPLPSYSITPTVNSKPPKPSLFAGFFLSPEIVASTMAFLIIGFLFLGLYLLNHWHVPKPEEPKPEEKDIDQTEKTKLPVDN